VRARHWADLIASGEVSTVRELAQRSGLDRHSVTQQLRCAALSPQFIKQILAGKQLLTLTALQMSRDIPLGWQAE